MNVEMSFRTVPNEEEISVVREIGAYVIKSLFNRKLKAANQRIAGRHLYDLAFIPDQYGDLPAPGQVERCDEFTRDYERLADRFDQAFRSDRARSFLSRAEDRALMLRIAIERQLARRGRAVLDRAAPRDLTLAQALAMHHRWLESSGAEGRRADLTGFEFTGMVLCGLAFRTAVLRGADFAGAVLRNADLRETDLRDAIFDGTTMLGTDLLGTSLTTAFFGPTTKGVAGALESVP